MDETQNDIKEVPEMGCRDCTVEHDLKGYLTTKAAIVAAFAVLVSVLFPSIAALFSVIFFIISPIKDDVADLKKIADDVSDINVSIGKISQSITETIPAVYPTKEQLMLELSKKLDIDRADGRLIKNK